jgi:seryl-tRNA synthetase
MFSRSFNLKHIYENAASFQRNCAKRNMPDSLPLFTSLYEKHRTAQFELSQLKRTQNTLSKSIKSSNDVEKMKDEGKRLRSLIHDAQRDLDQLHETLLNAAANIPNSTHSSVPEGFDPILVEQLGDTPVHKDWLRDHVDLASELELCDFNRASKVSGSGFFYLKNMGALLEFALVRYAIDKCLQKGFTPIISPDLIRYNVLEACGFSPRSDDPQTYFVEPHSKPSDESSNRDPFQLCLTATSEFPLAAMHANEVLYNKALPMKYVAFSHCFRAEGMAGALNRGLYRVHQFSKVEMFALSTPSQSQQILDEFVSIQKEIFQGLGLSFRILNMPATDLGAPAHIKYDIETYLPVRKIWGELSSASNCTDYQSRRLNIKYYEQEAKTEFAHTINGTAIAIPRVIMAILENNQTEAGEVIVPDALRPYLYGKEKIVKPQQGKIHIH